MKQIGEDKIRRIIWDKYKVDGYTLFYEVPKERRKEIIADTFETITKYRLVKGKGLVSRFGRGKDVISGYINFDHIRSIASLAFDITQTIKSGLDPKAINRRKAFRKKKEALQKKRQKRIQKLNRKEHLQKWEPQDEKTKKRIQEIRELRNKEIKRKFDL